MEILARIRSVVDTILRWFCIILFVLLVSFVLVQVSVRLLGVGAAWTEAMARIVFIWQGIVGAAYVIGENDDVAIDFLVRKFPGVVVKILEVLAHAIVAFFAIWIMIGGGWRLVVGSVGQTIELLPFTQSQVYMILPISGALIAFYCLLNIIGAITTKRVRPDEEDVDISNLMEEGI